MNKCDISVIVPLNNEEGSLPELYERLDQTLSQIGKSYEIILVNDGSTDDSERILNGFHLQSKKVVVVHFFNRAGKAAALECGFNIARGEYIITIDSDLQHAPEDIPKLIEKMDEGYDVVSGKRVDRHDTKGKILTSRLFNKVMRMLTGLKFDDYFSGLKAFRLSSIRSLGIFGDLYRFAAALAFQGGFDVIEIPVSHFNRANGISRYNIWTRFKRAAYDLIVIFFTVTFTRKKAAFCSVLGAACLILGLLMFSRIWTGCFYLSQKFYGAGVFLSLIGLFLVSLRFASATFLQYRKNSYKQRRHNIKRILGELS